MISKETAARHKEIDYNQIIKDNDIIGYLVLQCQDLKSDYFAAASIVYYSYLNKIDVDLGKAELLKDQHLIAWVNTCAAANGKKSDNIAMMLAGMYQFIKWENQ